MQTHAVAIPCWLIQYKMCSDVVLVVKYCYSSVCHQAVQVKVCGWNMNQIRRRTKHQRTIDLTKEYHATTLFYQFR